MGSAISLPGQISHAQKLLLLQHSPIFGNLEEEKLQCLATCFRAKKRKKRTLLENFPTLVYVGEGELNVYSVTSLNGNMNGMGFLCKKVKGDIMIPFPKSSRNRLISSEPEEEKNPDIPLRKAAAVSISNHVKVECHTDSIILCLSTNAIDILSTKHRDLALILTKLTADITLYMRNLKFLKGATTEQLKLFVDLCTLKSFSKGETVITEGEYGNMFYLILHGTCDAKLESKDSIQNGASSKDSSKVDDCLEPQLTSRQIFARSRKQSYQRLASMEKIRRVSTSYFQNDSVAETPDSRLVFSSLAEGQYFGETALLIKTPRTCTIQCSSDCLFVCMDRPGFNRFLQYCPEAQRSMEIEMCERLLQQARAMNVPILGAFPTERIPTSALASKCKLHEYDPNEVVCQQGESLKSTFIIAFGELKKVKELSVPILGSPSSTVTLQRGNSFGEESMDLESIPYTVVAVTNVILLEITKEAEELIEGYEDLMALYQICQVQENCKLQHVLREGTAFQMLLQFLRDEHTEENVEFIQQVDKFKKNIESNKKHGESKHAESKQHDDNAFSLLPEEHAIYIVDEFIKENSPKQVNITSDMRTDLEQKIQKIADEGPTVITMDMFDIAYKEVMHLLDRDAFQRFKRSKPFEVLMKQYKNAPPF